MLEQDPPVQLEVARHALRRVYDRQLVALEVSHAQISSCTMHGPNATDRIAY